MKNFTDIDNVSKSFRLYKELKLENISVADGKIFIEPAISKNIESDVKMIENYLGKKNNEVCVDLRKLNMFDAIRTGALIATHILAKNITSKIELLSDCEDVISQLKILSLSNVRLLLDNEIDYKSKVVV